MNDLEDVLDWQNQFIGSVTNDQLDNAAVLFIPPMADEDVDGWTALMEWLRRRSEKRGVLLPLVVASDDPDDLWALLDQDAAVEAMACRGWVRSSKPTAAD